MVKPYKVVFIRLRDSDKKFKAIFYDRAGVKIKTVRFGAAGYSDYTIHKDPQRKAAYDARHHNNEHWRQPMTAGALSKWILWNLPSLEESMRDYRRRFNLQ